MPGVQYEHIRPTVVNVTPYINADCTTHFHGVHAFVLMFITAAC